MAPNAPARFAKMAYANVLAVQPAIAHARQTVRIAIAAKNKVLLLPDKDWGFAELCPKIKYEIIINIDCIYSIKCDGTNYKYRSAKTKASGGSSLCWMTRRRSVPQFGEQ